MNAVLRPASATPGAPGVDAAFLADPYPAYAAWRAAGPVQWSEDFFGGAWLLTRHAEVDAALRDPCLSARRTGGWVMQGAAERAGLQGFQRLFARAMLFLDAPDHPRLRRAMQAGFGAGALQRLAPAMAKRVDARLDAVDPGAGFDFIAALARPLPAEVIGLVLGLPEADAEAVAASEALADFIGSPRPEPGQARSAQRALLALVRRIEPVIAERRRAPGDDLVGRLVQAQADGGVADTTELLAQCAMLLFAGHETTRHLLGTAMATFAADPALWQRLRREPARLPAALREVLRHDSPVQYTGRRVTADRVLHGQTLRRGDLVLALIGSANRDPARHADPDRFDPDRAAGPPLSFGAGAHACIGAGLTLMEATLVFERLLQRLPRPELVGAPRRVASTLYRGYASLRVRSA